MRYVEELKAGGEVLCRCASRHDASVALVLTLPFLFHLRQKTQHKQIVVRNGQSSDWAHLRCSTGVGIRAIQLPFFLVLSLSGDIE